MDTADFYFKMLDKLFEQYLSLCNKEKSRDNYTAGYIQFVTNVFHELPVLDGDDEE